MDGYAETFSAHALPCGCQRGTLEEQKYLRQVYKTQLKNETIVDVEEEQRDVAARLFRGVDGDKSRRGELFGIANLFRFKDGTFMQYGDETRDSHRYGGDIYNVGSLISAAQAAGEEGLEAIVGGDDNVEGLVEYAAGVDDDSDDENEGVQDLVGLTENGTCRVNCPFRVFSVRYQIANEFRMPFFRVPRCSSSPRRNARG